MDARSPPRDGRRLSITNPVEASMPAVSTVLVVGAGIAGTAAAILLAEAGVAVDLVEVKPEATALGSGDHPAGQRVAGHAAARGVGRRAGAGVRLRHGRVPGARPGGLAGQGGPGRPVRRRRPARHDGHVPAGPGGLAGGPGDRPARTCSTAVPRTSPGTAPPARTRSTATSSSPPGTEPARRRNSCWPTCASCPWPTTVPGTRSGPC